MQSAVITKVSRWGFAAILTMAMAGGSVAVFEAPAPGADLVPIDGAELLVSITQVNDSILWSSLSGNVNLVTTIGWPASDGEHDLGGALVMERPESALAGAISAGDNPMSVTFDLDG